MTILHLQQWLIAQGQNSHAHVRKISPSHSREWIYSSSSIKHKTNRFFQIIGVHWMQGRQKKRQLFINQREIGLLGFILYKGKTGNKVLLQAKVEPGNTYFARIAPTCQATLSNLEKVHGGSAPLFANYFTDPNKHTLSDSLQSEQGMRFFGKRNRNVVVSIDKQFRVAQGFRWVDAALLCRALSQNYLVNSDARSVIVTTNWEQFVGRPVFSGKDSFSQELKDSYYSPTEMQSTESVMDQLKHASGTIHSVKVVGLDRLDERRTTSTKEKSKDGVRLFHVRVNVRNREVDSWDQPMVSSVTSRKYVIYCGRFARTLYFLFKLWEEPGLYNHVELGPNLESGRRKGKVRLSSWQSDEGGRFYKDKNKYSLIDLGEIKSSKDNEVWLSLRQVQALSVQEGMFNNEARSNISLILALA
jgi:oxidase EvaA